MNLKKRPFLIYIALTVVVLGGASWYKFIYLPGLNAPPSAAQLQSWQFATGSLTTNLQGSSMIQVQFTLQAPNINVVTQLGEMTAQVDDAIIGVLHNLSAGDINQSGGTSLLRGMVLNRINHLLKPQKITQVYINSIIVQ